MDTLVAEPLPHQVNGGRARYDLNRALRLAAREELDGLELECSQEIAHRSQRSPQGFFLPLDVAVRSVTTTTGSGAIADVVGRPIVDILRSKLVTAAMGARFLSDLKGGTFALPVKTATVSLGMVAEGANASSSNFEAGHQVVWTPRTTGAYTDISRKAWVAIEDIAALVSDDLTGALAAEVDRLALNGSGVGLEPIGILQNPNVATVAINTNGGAPTRSTLVDLEETVGLANADIGSLAYCTSPTGRRVLKSTEKASGTGRYLWDDDSNNVNGHPCSVTNNIPADLNKGSGSSLTALLFGNWQDLQIGTWGAADIQINRYVWSVQGYYRVRALLDVDAQIRHDGSFAKTVDVATS